VRDEFYQNDIMFQEQLEFSIADPEKIEVQEVDPALKQLIWTRILMLLKETILFNPERVQNHNRAVVEEVIKCS